MTIYASVLASPSSLPGFWYGQQQDIHLDMATVREALQFSALMRQSVERSRKEKLEYVEHVIELLDMSAYADAVIGIPGQGLLLSIY